MRVAVLCDYLEENWPSMNLVGDMLLTHLHASGVDATLVRPAMKPRLGPLLKSSSGANADRLINRFHDYPAHAKNLASFDLFHVVDHSYSQLIHSLSAHRTIVTCHDIDTFRCLLKPATGEPNPEKRPYWFRAMTRHILRGLERAACVICVSQATRAALLEHDLCAPERLRVVHNGIDRCFQPAPDRYWDDAAAQLLGPSGEYVELLHVGSTIPRKRLDVLLDVVAECRKALPRIRLVRVGAPLTFAQQTRMRTLDLEPSSVCLPFLDRDLLAAVYRRAALTLITSEAEGFGLPVAESMGCGTPVIASDIPALREVGGDRVRYCPVADIEAWAAAVRELLEERSQDPAAWQTRSASCIRRARRFSWSQNAAQVAEIYREVLSRNA